MDEFGKPSWTKEEMEQFVRDLKSGLFDIIPPAEAAKASLLPENKHKSVIEITYELLEKYKVKSVEA